MAQKKGGLNFNDESIQDIFNYNNPDYHRARAVSKMETSQQETIKQDVRPQQAQTRSENEAREKQSNIGKKYTKHETPTTNNGLKGENKRTSLIINGDQLEIIDALTSYTNIKKVEVLTQLLQKGIDELNRKQPDLIHNALDTYRAIKKSLF